MSLRHRRGAPPWDATPLLAAYARWRIGRVAALDAAATQEAVLRRLIRRAAGTRFGIEHGFARLDGVAPFQQAVPLRRYEEMHAEYWAPALPTLRDISWPGLVPFLALSSGTSSGTTKYIPVSQEMVRANAGAALDTLCWHMARHPRSRVFAGRSFMLGGSTALTGAAPDVRQGDLSGIAAATMPRWARPWSWPPERIALMADWDRKLEALAAETPREAIRVLSGTPSWLLVLLEKLAARGAMPPLPMLELLVHGGVAWAPYRERIAPFLPEGCATREVYAASEGFFAIADAGEGEGMRLVLDRGCFFEFVPVEELGAAEPRRHWVATIETGVEYAIAVASCAGLFGYLVGDTVRFVSRNPPRLLVTGRTAWFLSAFGEHLSGEEIEAALLRAARESGIAVAEFAVGPEFDGARGRHRWLVESAAEAQAEAAALAARLDALLIAANEDYAAHRAGGQLAPPVIVLLPPGRFEAWLRAEHRLGGQNKVPRVVADPERFARMAAWLQA